MAYTFISPIGEKVTTPTIAAFSRLTGLRYSNCKSLACGHYQTLHGWCSTHKRASKRRKRFTVVMINTRTARRECIGKSIKEFAQRNRVCANDISLVLAGKKLAAKGWMPLKTWEAAHPQIAEKWPEKEFLPT
jgi:hypothetical protein